MKFMLSLSTYFDHNNVRSFIVEVSKISQSIEITQNKVDEGLMMDDIVEKSYRMI